MTSLFHVTLNTDDVVGEPIHSTQQENREPREENCVSWKDHFRRGNAAYRQHDYVQAEREFNRALQLRPQCVPLLSSRASLLGRLQRFVEVIADGKRMMELEPRNPLGYLFACKAYRKRNQLELAWHVAEQGLANVPTEHEKYPDLVAFHAALKPMLRREPANCTLLRANKAADEPTPDAVPEPGQDFLPRFPNEILQLIFQYLNFNDCVRASQVSRLWRTYCSNNRHLWKQIAVSSTHAPRFLNQHLQFICSRAQEQLTTLLLPKCSSLTSPALDYLAQSKCKNLQCLSLDGNAGLDMQRLADNLRKLALVRRVEGAKCQGLTALSLCQTRLTDTDLVQILLHCPALVDLRVKENPGLAGFPQLYHLELQSGKHAATTTQVRLRSLHLSGCSHFQHTSIPFVKTLWNETLRALFLVDCPNVGAHLFLELPASLEILHLSHLAPSSRTQGGQLSVNESLPLWASGGGAAALQDFALTHCRELNDFGLGALLNAATGLVRLNVTECQGLRDGFVSSLKNLLQQPTFRHLHLAQCVGISQNAFLQHIAPHARYLETLDVSGSSYVNDRFFSKYADSVGEPCPLVRLLLNGCVEVQGHGLAQLVRICPQLHWLEMNFCYRIKNELATGIRTLVRGQNAVVKARVG